jgi:hypothetical protein
MASRPSWRRLKYETAVAQCNAAIAQRNAAIVQRNAAQLELEYKRFDLSIVAFECHNATIARNIALRLNKKNCAESLSA